MCPSWFWSHGVSGPPKLLQSHLGGGCGIGIPVRAKVGGHKPHGLSVSQSCECTALLTAAAWHPETPPRAIIRYIISLFMFYPQLVASSTGAIVIIKSEVHLHSLSVFRYEGPVPPAYFTLTTPGEVLKGPLSPRLWTKAAG